MHEPFHEQNEEANGNYEFLQPYPDAPAHALLTLVQS
jgi:hypothetical protein